MTSSQRKAFAELYLSIARGEPALDALAVFIREHSGLLRDFFTVDTLMHAAAEGEVVEAMELLANAGLAVDAPDSSGRVSPLVSAVWHNKPNAVSWLLDHGANVEGIAERPNPTPLAYAAEMGSLELVKLLVEHGADVNVRFFAGTDEDHEVPLTPLMRCERYPEITDYLRANGAVDVLSDEDSAKPTRGLRAEITHYLTQFLGEPAEKALVDVVPTSLPPVSVQVFPQTHINDSLALVTSGMSEYPMHVPAGKEANMFAELVFHLDPQWPIRGDLPVPDESAWPIALLKRLASYPFENKTYYEFFNVLRLADLGIEYREAALSAVLIAYDEDMKYLALDDRVIVFFYVFPLYADEYELYLKEGIETLQRAFCDNGIEPVFFSGRRSVAVP
jgi:hypothetical protein